LVAKISQNRLFKLEKTEEKFDEFENKFSLEKLIFFDNSCGFKLCGLEAEKLSNN